MVDISVGAGALGAAFLGTIVVVLAIIFIMKQVYKKRGQGELSEKYRDKSGDSDLRVRNKYPEVDVFNLSGTFLRLGMVLALGLIVLAFGWTQYEKKVLIPEDALVYDEDIEIEPPRTAEPPPPPPPPQEEEIFKVVEEMPRFPGCENEATTEAKKACADKKMLEFIYKNIKYPAIARENGIEGNVVITFVVEKDGVIKDARVVRDIGGQCGQEALRVVNLMNEQNIKWAPGKQRGRPVRVQFNLPVKFKLEG